LEAGPPPLGGRTTDSANASGSHRAGALSSYNACREGFVFSNGDSYGVDGVPEFEPATIALLSAASAAARSLFAALERQMQLPAGWFEACFGPLADHSQWHLKRYCPEAAPPHATTADGRRVMLPVHSDPSLLSLVLHDAPGRQPGGLA